MSISSLKKNENVDNIDNRNRKDINDKRILSFCIEELKDVDVTNQHITDISNPRKISKSLFDVNFIPQKNKKSKKELSSNLTHGSDSLNCYKKEKTVNLFFEESLKNLSVDLKKKNVNDDTVFNDLPMNEDYQTIDPLLSVDSENGSDKRIHVTTSFPVDSSVDLSSANKLSEFWIAKKLPSNNMPILFKGNKDSNKVTRSSMHVDSKIKPLINNDFFENIGSDITFDDSTMDTIEYNNSVLKKTYDLSNDDTLEMERQWYDNEESSYTNPEHYSNDNWKDIEEKEKHLRFRQSQLDQLKKRQKYNLKESLRNADQDIWEINRLSQSGLAKLDNVVTNEIESHNLILNYLNSSDDTESSVHVLVREVKPPFLDERIVYTTQIETVPTIKDPTADLAVLAKRGSMVVKHLREMEDKSKMRQRFWELGGSNIGNLIGIKNDYKTKKELEEDSERNLEVENLLGEKSLDYKKNSQFCHLISDSKSETAFLNTKNCKIEEQRRSLPIFGVRDELMSTLRTNQVLVVIGETGSGKTTQLAQYLYEEGYTRNGVIGCTQPRRVAAVSVAKRVAEEMNTSLGKEVGYAIRFEDCTSASSIIVYMTDGILLRESLSDPDLDRYSVIIMDEAHERSLNTDILFGILRGIVAKRRDFRLIITSATMNAEKFSRFFGDCRVFDVPGRKFPVRIEYTRTPVEDYVDASVQKCLQIHCSFSASDDSDESLGDILIFMTGKEDIEATCYLIADRCSKLGDKFPPLTVLPIYSTLPSDLQAKIFEKSKYRKVIVATNIAETSLTVDGIRYVIDCGYSKLKVYNSKIGMDSLQISPISQANAQQRAGRAGRTQPGVCYRMYTERAYLAELFENNIPEIQRTNLCHTVLLLKSLGVNNLLEFDFMDPPPHETILNSMYQLWVLGALDNFGALTDAGSKMIQFPLDPPLAKMILTAESQKCTAEVLIVVSMLSVPSVFYRPKDRAEECDAVREKFFVPESDHLTLLNTYCQWKRNLCNPQWAASHFINQKAMVKVREIYTQLHDIMRQQNIDRISSNMDWDVVRKALCSGYFQNASKIRGIGEYVNLRTSVPCRLHPSSALFGAGSTPEYIVYHEVVLTTKEYMQNVTAVEPQWLAELGPMFFYLKEQSSCLAEKSKEEQEANLYQRNEFEKKLIDDLKKKNEKKFHTHTKEKPFFNVAIPGVRPHK